MSSLLFLRTISQILMNFQVGVIGNLVHSSPNIKKEVLLAGALQPVIGLLRYCLILNSCHLCTWFSSACLTVISYLLF